MDMMGKDLQFLNKRIITPPAINQEFEGEMSKALENTKVVLSLLCDFDYLVVETVL